MMKQQLKLLSVMIASAFALAACGGGGGGSSTTPADTPVSLSGFVVDGYLEGAKVCLDLNNNQTCDTGEPSAVSAAGGAYSIDITAYTSAQLSNVHLVTEVLETAKDADDLGKTLAQAGKKPYTLLAPVSSYVSFGADGIKTTVAGAAIVSPLTTLVSHNMIVNTGQTVAAAQTAVSARLNLPTTVLANPAALMQDFKAKNGVALGQVAAATALALGNLQNAVRTSSAGASTDSRVVLLAALAGLQQSINKLIVTLNAAGTGVVSTTTVAAAMASQLATVQASAASLTAIAQQTTASTPVDVMTILTNGFFNGYQLFASQGCPVTVCVPGYHLLKGTANLVGSAYDLVSGVWVTSTPSSSAVVLSASGWSPQPVNFGGSLVSDGNGGGTLTETASGRVMRVSGRTVNLAGLTAGSVAGLSAPAALATLVFPAGSELYWFTLENLTENYELYTADSGVYTGSTCTLATTATPSVCTTNYATSIAQMTAAFPTPATTLSYSQLMLRNNAAFTFDAGGTAAGGKLTLWTSPATAPCTAGTTCTQPAPSKIGSANYEIRTVNGQQILVTLGTGNAANNRGEEIAFAVYNGKLHGGSYTPVGAVSDREPGFNRTAFDAILGKAGLPAAK